MCLGMPAALVIRVTSRCTSRRSIGLPETGRSVHDSARKHGIDPHDAVHAAEHAVFVRDLDDDSPARQLRLGFDTAGRILELEVLRFDSDDELVIHAMKARRRYLDLLD